MTLLGESVSTVVDGELKKFKEIMRCDEGSGRSVITRGCEGKGFPQNHKSVEFWRVQCRE